MPVAPRLRPGRIADAAVLTDILHRSKGSWGYPEPEMAGFRANNRVTPATLTSQTVIVAELDGRPVAFATGEAREDHLFVDYLFVAPEAQGLGLGRLLLAALEDHARSAGLAHLRLESDANAVGFYRRLGFGILGDRASTMIPTLRIPLMQRTLADPVLPLSGLALTFDPAGRWSFETDNEAAIAAHWRAAVARNPHMWNGRMLQATDLALTPEGLLSGSCVEIAFASFIAWRDWGCPDRNGANVFGSAVVRAAGGELLFGVMGPKTANHGLIYPPGGSLDPGDLRPDGTVDLEGSIARELLEETGLCIDEAEPGALFAVRDGPRLSVARELRFAADATRLRARMLAHSRQTPEEELADVLILERASDLPAAQVPAFARLIARHLIG
ncbi:GNAT family N-acetyltransferase [Microvirga tunisiensis]|uniref:GNAT family N-acetyltransferase n=1 Tax=Pannonibacter tanglangensis TaxID=2750084 RepID=A0A7X5EZL2_9HYPH|nr:GNAT family N-acetyltransferase [Pannonibacter sp. XCT-53]NBN77045.1 GNAT family N-acetyltransferase [Pannonibacter sp. XCT-53]